MDLVASPCTDGSYVALELGSPYFIPSYRSEGRHARHSEDHGEGIEVNDIFCRSNGLAGSVAQRLMRGGMSWLFSSHRHHYPQTKACSKPNPRRHHSPMSTSYFPATHVCLCLTNLKRHAGRRCPVFSEDTPWQRLSLQSQYCGETMTSSL